MTVEHVEMMGAGVELMPYAQEVRSLFSKCTNNWNFQLE